ncbi:hypothetical protein ABZY90_19665 [Streptomyces sp. NPDC006422]|uniref:hypothetical protein n=1 Tax=unclassified Streptomyces TaxID=2593676 RepID=UPI0033AFF8C4
MAVEQLQVSRERGGEGGLMSERVRVWVVLLFGDEAEVAADAEDALDPVRYPAAEIAEAVGLPVGELAGRRLTAVVGADERLSGWRLAE